MKNPKKLLVLVFFACATCLSAQDKIQKKQGDILNVKVIEINEDQVIYRLPNDPNGPVYRLKKENITRITFENGLVQTFGAEPTSASPYPVKVVTDPMVGTEIYMSSNFGKNIVNFDFLSILYFEVGMSYERILNNGFVGFKVPFILGMGENTEFRLRNIRNVYQTGLDVNLYPTGQGAAKYFIGPAIRFGEAYRNPYDSFFDSNTGVYVDYVKKETFNLFAFQINNGIVFQPTGHFNVSLLMGIGLRRLSDKRGTVPVKAENYAVFQANVAYRF